MINAPKDEIYIVQSDSSENQGSSEHFLTAVEPLQNDESATAIRMLADMAVQHRIIKNEKITEKIIEKIILNASTPVHYIYNTVTESRYDSTKFKGILVDSGAVARSTEGLDQLQTLQRLDDSVKLDHSTIGSANFIFGMGGTTFIGSINLNTPMSLIVFHIIKANTPFLLCLADMDSLGTFFNNLTNRMIQGTVRHPMVRRYGHAFLLWHIFSYSLITESFPQNLCYLTDVELRRLHRRFGHPSVRRLQTILERSGHADDIDIDTLRHLTKYCEHCQRHGQSPGRFNFTIRENIDFNFNIIVDILHISGRPVLHLVDQSTRFQAGRWLKEISTKHVWDQLRSCWIDTYLDPPDFITADAGRQFIAREFKQYATNIGITVKNVPVEAHHSIGQVERYHEPFRRIYTIIITEIPSIDLELALQMAFKAINDSVGSNGLVPTLFVFGAYPRMMEMDAPSLIIIQRGVAMRKAIEEVRKINTSRLINDALNMRNGPSTISVHDLPLNSPVLVFREGPTGHAGSWKRPFKLLGLEGETAVIELSSGLTRFRITSVKPYYQNEEEDVDENQQEVDGSLDDQDHRKTLDDQAIREDHEILEPLDVVRPTSPTSSSIDLAPPPSPLIILQPVKRGRGRPRKFPLHVNLTFTSASAPDFCFVIDDLDPQPDLENSHLNLPQFAASRQKEITGLLEMGVFKLVNEILTGARLFNSRFVDEVRNAGTEKAYEKSRLVVQAYNDPEKDIVLTQSPTIQRVS